MQQPDNTQLMVTPTTVTIHRSTETDDYLAQLHVSPGATPFTEWLVVTPGQPLHPEYHPNHWVGEPLGGATGGSSAFPGVVSCPVHTDRLDPQRSHRALLFVVLRLRPDAVVTQRIPFVVTEARAPAPPQPLLVCTRARPSRTTPTEPETPPPTVAIPSPIPAWIAQPTSPAREQFCPKDGRKRQVRG